MSSRLAYRLLAVAALSALPAHALRSGWAYVPGAQDLVRAGQWSCVSGVAAASGSLTIAAGASYNTVIDTAGPTLAAPGDFSVLATLSAGAGSGAALTLVGTLSDGSAWWSGLKRLDVGLGNGSIQVSYWTGSSANASGQSFPLPAASTGALDLEVARIGGQIAVFAGGSPVGSFADPGLFASGRVYFGFNVPPQNTLDVLSLAAAMPAGGGAALSSPDLQVDRTGFTGLRDLADKSGFLVGAAVDPSHFSNSGYAQALGREFNLVVAENAMKFDATEPAPHQFSFCAADRIVQFAQANGMRVRGHNLVWQQALPAWLTSGNYSSAEAAAILQEHIDTVMGHHQGQVIDWDVVNEAIAYGSPYGPQPSYWLNQLGSSYVDMAFQWAHQADPNAKLFYNDTGGEGLGAKSDAVYNLVKGLIGRGVPIHGVGLQMHVTPASAPSPADLAANIARLGALGLEVHITEMDVRVPVDSAGKASAADLADQAAVYRNVFSVCQAAPNCTAILTWGVSDAYSWIPAKYPGFGAALLLDAAYNPKPAYDSARTSLPAPGASPRPAITPGGIVIHGGAATVVSPGSLVDVYGSNLAADKVTAAGAPLPADLGGIRVKVNGGAAPLYYVGPDQIVFQMPYEVAPGPAAIQVVGAAGSSQAVTIGVQEAAPSILTVQNPDYSLNSPANCAPPGSWLTVYLIGSGPLDGSIATGAAAPLAPLLRETLATTATIGGAPAPVEFAGMAPLAVGLMQVNVQAPAISGSLPLAIQVGDYASNRPLVCVR